MKEVHKMDLSGLHHIKFTADKICWKMVSSSYYKAQVYTVSPPTSDSSWLRVHSYDDSRLLLSVEFKLA